MLAILLAGGTDPQTALWTTATLLLYIAGYCLENSIVAQRRNCNQDDWILDADQLHRQLTALPPEAFPQNTRYTTELNAGTGHDRFQFTVTLMLNGLARPPMSEPSNPKSR